MKRIIQKSLIAAISVGIAGVSIQAHATNGYFAHGYGTKAKGMAGAGVAYAQDSLAAATNPAGMVWVGNRWDVGAEIFAPDRTARTAWGTENLGTPTNYDGNGDGFGEAWFLIPEVGYNRKMSDTWSLGISVFGNGGMNTSYTRPIFSTGATCGGVCATNTNTSIDLSQLFISPTISIKLDDNNSIGFSANLVYQRFEAKGMTDFGVANAGVDDSFGVGFRVGWTGKLTDTVMAGVTYQPRTRMAKFGKYNTLFAESGSFDIPANFAAGVSWKATPEMTVAFDVERINYEGIKSISNPNNFMVDGSATSAGFGWEDMNIYKLGFDYQFNKDLVVRAGWNHGEQPIPEGETLFNVVAPATVEDHLTVGFTYNMQDGAELSGYYMHAFENTVTGTSGGDAIFGDANSTSAANIGMSQNAFGIAYGRSF